jgi:nitrogen fixation/metabolism regulation signal transduction histidine kinase
MNSERFRIRIIVQVILIAVAGLLVVWSFAMEGLVVARFTFLAVWILLIVYLIHFVNRSSRTLQSFLESVRYLDKIRSTAGKGKSFGELDRLYDEIVGVVRKVETERESNRHYLKHTIDHIGSGILSFNERGEVELVNEAAKKLFNVRNLRHISALGSVSPELPELLKSLHTGQQRLLKMPIDHEMVGLSIKATEFRLLDRKVKLVSIQNIKNELEEEELDAWQKLIRVLTHEIMNSVTPVNSLTKTIIRMFEEDGTQKSLQELDEDTIKNALEGLHSIEKRSGGLIGFVQSYRSLTRIQKPAFADLRVGGLFKRISTLVARDLENSGIKLSMVTQGDDLHLFADEKLIEQVLINLVNNAVYALQDTASPEIRFNARTEGDDLLIEVHDNGAGIPAEIAESIFIPFFTTKEEGSGIGLSLSRQIMRMHGGSISVRSKPGATVFILRFPR